MIKLHVCKLKTYTQKAALQILKDTGIFKDIYHTC